MIDANARLIGKANYRGGGKTKSTPVTIQESRLLGLITIQFYRLLPKQCGITFHMGDNGGGIRGELFGCYCYAVYHMILIILAQWV